MTTPAFELMRRIRGWRLAQNSLRTVPIVWAGGAPIYRVPSETRPGISYDVFFDEDGVMVCSCADFGARHRPCKHNIEVLYRFYVDSAPPAPRREELERLGPSEMYANARRFKRAAHLYMEGPAESTRHDRALANEPQRMESLLSDLASVLNARFPQVGAHRHALAAGDRVFALTYREYHKKSYRVAPWLLSPLAESNRIAFAPCKATLIAYMQDVQTTTFLREAFLLTIAPFRLMEQDLLVDESGISPFYFESYRAIKYGNHQSPEAKWFRMHIAIGRISRAVLGFVLTPSDGSGTGDVSHLSGILDSVEAAGFELRYVIADNAYLTAEKIADVGRRGGRLICPMKGRNHKKDGTPNDSIRPLAEFAAMHPGIYDELIRARQPIEGFFSMEKRRSNRLAAIGTAEEREGALKGVRSSLFRARVNEFYLRMIRHNLTRISLEEHLRNRHIRFSKGSLFSHIREMIEGDDVA